METTVTEVAPDVFRLSTYIGPPSDLIFSQFLVRDDEPLLYHTGMRSLFPGVLDAASRVIDPATLKWIVYSHFEVDECGAMNEWLGVAPSAQPAGSLVGVLVNQSDFTARRANGLVTGDVIETGRHRFRFVATPHLPHGWDAGHLFDETTRTLLASDILHQNGSLPPTGGAEILERSRAALVGYESTPLHGYMPYTPRTDAMIAELADLEPQTIASMHGSVFIGDGRQAIQEFGRIIREVAEGGERTQAA